MAEPRSDRGLKVKLNVFEVRRSHELECNGFKNVSTLLEFLRDLVLFNFEAKLYFNRKFNFFYLSCSAQQRHAKCKL